MLSLIGLISLTAYLSIYMQIVPDSTFLAWQIFGLLSIPFYVYLIRKKSEDQLQMARESLEHVVVRLVATEGEDLSKWDRGEKVTRLIRK